MIVTEANATFAYLDFLPSLITDKHQYQAKGLAEVRQLLVKAKNQGKQKLHSLLSQSLPKALVLELQKLWWAAYADTPMAEIPDAVLKHVADRLNNWQLKPSGTEGYRTAEVTLGGVDTQEVSSKTMESNLQSGLYFVGEVLDVSGHLGGYNFQWAWSSGFSAGVAI